ncbi:MAG: class I SAM-dependent methyltransferase, partial [Rhodospirillales bacterium]|nr:class I SAM-dependent methyltransferase [Rhodospirillales bacterium]
VLYLYGPYRRDGRHTAPSNAEFDESLRSRNPDWGLRDLEAVAELAGRHGLELREVIEMPANNLSVLFVRS